MACIHSVWLDHSGLPSHLYCTPPDLILILFLGVRALLAQWCEPGCGYRTSTLKQGNIIQRASRQSRVQSAVCKYDIVNTFDINEFVKWDIIPRCGACPTPPTYLPRQRNSPRLEGQHIEAALKDSHCRSPRERPLAEGLNQLSVRCVT